MSSSPNPAPVTPETDNRPEQLLKTRELDVKERELGLKENELKRSPWTNPLALGLFAAALGLFGNIYTARINNQNAITVERLHNQSSLLIEAIKTSDPGAACKNLTLLVKLRYLEDHDNAIARACAAPAGGTPKGAPSLPAPVSASAVPGLYPENATVKVIDAVSHKPIPDARLFLSADEGMQGGPADDQGELKSGLLVNRFSIPRSVTITASKAGYLDKKMVVTVPAATTRSTVIELQPIGK